MLSSKQERQLRRRVVQVKEQAVKGALSAHEQVYREANRILGQGAWDRLTLATECVWKTKGPEGFHAVYTARVRVQVRAGEATIVRDGHGTGEAKGNTPGEAHEGALAAAEANATCTALATFGPRLSRRPRNGASPPIVATTGVHLEEPAAGFLEREPPSRTGLVARQNPNPPNTKTPTKVDKSALALPEPRRRRDPEHLRFVASQPCLVCGRRPSQAHHLRYMQPTAMARKVSDEFTVPLCGVHHSELHLSSNEEAWWGEKAIEPEPQAHRLWSITIGGRIPGDGVAG